MNTLRNKVQLIGNLGMDPEVKEIKKGRKMAKFSLATNETYKNGSGEKITETQWHNIVIWGKAADVAERFLQKGSEVAVEGKLISRSYNDKDGNKRYITEVEVRDLLLLGKKG
jgi:single-strand DNA-binding protein